MEDAFKGLGFDPSAVGKEKKDKRQGKTTKGEKGANGLTSASPADPSPYAHVGTPSQLAGPPGWLSAFLRQTGYFVDFGVFLNELFVTLVLVSLTIPQTVHLVVGVCMRRKFALIVLLVLVHCARPSAAISAVGVRLCVLRCVLCCVSHCVLRCVSRCALRCVSRCALRRRAACQKLPARTKFAAND